MQNQRVLTHQTTLRRNIAAATALAALLLAGGCSQSAPERPPVYPLSGKVVYQGRPAAGAWVTLHPTSGQPGAPQPRAKTDSQGNFVVSTFDAQDGAPAGEYRVTLELTQIVDVGGELQSGPSLLPPQYGSPATTTIVARVNEGENTLPITITR
jgi:hypothetical protein